MLTYLVIVIVSVIAGGYGGYKYGASVERKAAATAVALAASVTKTASKV